MRAHARKPYPGTLRGSLQSRKQAAVILEVLSGTTTTVDAARALQVTLGRYYQLEARALQGVLAALEPRRKGKRSDPVHELDKLRRDNERFQRDVTRLQALLRASQRAIGLTAPKPADRSRVEGKRKRRPTARALRAVDALRTGQNTETPAAEAEA